MGKKVKHLRDELIRTFLLYALIPIFIVMAISSGLAVWYWNNNVVERNHICLSAAGRSVENLLTTSQEKVTALAEDCQLEKLGANNNYKVEMYKKLYAAKNSFASESDFYVFDKQRNVLLGSRKLNSEHFFATQSVSWGLIKRLNGNPRQAAYEFISPIDNFSQTMDIVVGKAVLEGEEIKGYIIFIISGNRVLNDIANPYVDIVVKDSFDYAPICTNAVFCDELHKLKEEYRSFNGYASMAKTKFYVSKQPIMEGKLTVYSFTSISSMMDQFIYAGFVLVMVLCLLSILVVFGIKQQAVEKTKMIDRLVEGFAAVKNGNLNHKVKIDTDNEFKLIGESYNLMLDSLQELIKNNEAKAKETVISEIKQLESQFNPHFLFNTLENIRYMIKLNPDSAGRMILALSNLLRYSINNTGSDVTLKDDLKYLNSYLDIQKLRFGIKLNYAIEAEAELYSCVVPKLFLQPIVENAIKYGLINQDSLFVEINLKRSGESIIVQVYDNGAGLSPAEVGELNARLLKQHNESNHSGLYNVNRRIKLLYGDSYGLRVQKNTKAGITVHMVLPYKVNEVI